MSQIKSSMASIVNRMNGGEDRASKLEDKVRKLKCFNKHKHKLVRSHD